MNKVLNYLALLAAYVRLNLRSHLEYRGAFISQVAAMAVNDVIWIVFWSVFFTRFNVLRGWDVKDVLTIWAITASGFGLAAAIFGNALHLANLIARGQLDAWLLYPRAVLPHLILGKMSASAWGDVIFGYAVYFAFVHPDWPHAMLFLFFTLTAAILILGFFIVSGSLGFFVGNAESIAEQWRFSLITFSTYPATLFEGTSKLLLYTVIPAGFVSYLPIQALHRLSLSDALLTLLAALFVLALGVAVFYIGLRRYESSNLMELRG